MNKHDFLAQLRRGLTGLSPEEIEEHTAFYGEMIDDRMEEGLTEEEAVAAIGSVDEVAAQIAAQAQPKPVEGVLPKRRVKPWVIVLLAAGSPVWLPLLIAAFAVALSLYITLWALVITLWAIDFALAASALYGVASAVLFAVQGYYLTGLAALGAGLLCAGAAIFLVFGCLAASKGTVRIIKAIVLKLKKRRVRHA